MQSLHLNWPL